MANTVVILGKSVPLCAQGVSLVGKTRAAGAGNITLVGQSATIACGGPPGPTVFDVVATLTPTGPGNTWHINITSTPNVLESTGLSVGGVVEFNPPVGGGNFSGHLEQGGDGVFLTGFPVEEDQTVQYAVLQVAADNPNFVLGGLVFSY